MNLSKSAVRRYRIIDGMLRNSRLKYPNMAEIINTINAKLDFEPSSETIQKDIANMRLPYPDGFDAPINYCYRNKGYEYTDANYSLSGIALRQEDLETICEAVDLIRCIGGSRISEQFNHAVEKLLAATIESSPLKKYSMPVLQTMIPPASMGMKHFDILYEACKERITLSMLYFSNDNRHFMHTFLDAFLVKEFNNRWYVIGYSEKHQAIKTFGLDRISEPLKIKRTYRETSPKIIESYLHEMYGVHPLAAAKKETISIYASAQMTQDFEAYPIHVSQVIKKEGSGAAEITFQLIPTKELASYFLSKGSQLKITGPQNFINSIQSLV